MNIEFLTRLASATQWFALSALLIFTPLARGATERWAFYISLWLGLLAMTAMILKRMWQGERLLPRSPLDFPLALLFFMVVGFYSASIYKEATFWALLRLLLYITVYYLAIEATESRSQTRWLLITLLGTGTLISFLGFIKYAGGPMPAFWVYSKNGQESQLISTFVNRNHLAGYLEMVFALGLGFILFRPAERILFWSSCLLLILVGLFLSMSRGGWIATFTSLIFIGILFFRQKGMNKVKIYAMTLALFLTVSLSFLGSNTMIERLHSFKNPNEPSFLLRLSAWKGCTKLILEDPLHGTGLGTFPWSFTAVRSAGLPKRWREAHNDYLQIVTEMGLLVLVPIAWGLLLVFRTGLQTFWRTKSRFRAGVTLGGLGAIMAILVHSVIDFNIQITSNGILFCVLVGLVMGSATSKKIEPKFREIH